MRRLLLVLALALAAAPPPVAQLPLHRCYVGGATGLCGRLVVPENRAQPRGRTIALRVMVLPAAGKRMPDPVFYLAGGPGGAATDSAATMRTTYFELNERHDIVL